MIFQNKINDNTPTKNKDTFARYILSYVVQYKPNIKFLFIKSECTQQEILVRRFFKTNALLIFNCNEVGRKRKIQW
jgi:hypothetical protein